MAVCVNLEAVFQVFKTIDYSMFKIMSDNRDVNQMHVKRLVNSFQQKHLISPIIVNEKLQVIDGQHRLQASQETQVPVYYIIIPGYGIDEVQVLNTNQKNWNKIDFLEMYCSQGMKPYLQLKEFMVHFPEFGIQGAEKFSLFFWFIGQHFNYLIKIFTIGRDRRKIKYHSDMNSHATGYKEKALA